MSYRLTTKEQQFILREMLALARYLTARQMPAPQVHRAVKRLRDDLRQMIGEGMQPITVDCESYGIPPTDQEEGSHL